MSLDIMKARAVIALIIGAGVWGLVAFLQERAVFEPTVFVILAALSFAVQTWFRGLPMQLPRKLQGTFAELRETVGERVWVWVQAGSGLWVAVQALAFGLVSLLAQAALVRLLGGTEFAAFVGTVLAVAACSFGLGILVRRLREVTGIPSRFARVWARFQADTGVEVSVHPIGGLALWSLLRAVAVQLLKMLVVAWSAYFFSWWFALVLGALVLLSVFWPEVKKFFKPKEAAHVGDN